MNSVSIHPKSWLSYQSICQTCVLPFGDLAFGHSVSRRFKQLVSFQWKSADEIHSYRQSRVRDLLKSCGEHVLFYQRVFRDLGVESDEFLSFDLDRLPTLPILTKQDLRECFDDLRVTNFRKPITKMMSSGSTGTQTVTLIDKAVFNEVYATQLLFWSWGGFGVGQAHLQTGMSLKRGLLRTLKDRLFLCTYVSAFGLSDFDLQRVVDVIRRKRIRALFGYASSIYVIADYCKRKGIPLPMDCIFTWGDNLFPHYRELIEEMFSCPVNDCYGLGEGLQCAAQCEQHDALHEAMNGVIIEIVDERGIACPTGQLGKVVVTRLEAGPMPLVRYDTGDVAYFVEGACDCGRQLRRISRIQGRATDIVTTPAGDRLIVHYFTQIFENIPQISQFQVRQTTANAIKILYVPREGFGLNLLERVRIEVLQYCKYELIVDFEEVREIPLEKSNKRRFVISSIPFGAD